MARHPIEFWQLRCFGSLSRHAVDSGDLWSGGRYRIRTYDFHRVKMALYR